MAETPPSSHLDALVTPQPHLSRRAAREAEARGAGSKRSARAVESTPTRRSSSAPAQAAPVAAVRKLKRSEVRAIRGSAAKPPRKNPFSVLATMTIVGGMFAVAGLPAYALNGTDGAVAEKEVPTQSVVVSANAETVAPTRDGYRATTPAQLAQMSKDALRANLNAEYLASGAREMGDDYPWPYELRDYQGGGLSPLNYYYRECVDFVAWRLNRDAGSYQAPYKWVWSNLTPTGGNGSQWLYAWEAHGWPVSNVPIVGSVAYTGYNHVAYVKAVNADGTVLLEEYNYGGNGKYGQRTIPASSVPAFLYPPPG